MYLQNAGPDIQGYKKKKKKSNLNMNLSLSWTRLLNKQT
jgi:hypothetical protein